MGHEAPQTTRVDGVHTLCAVSHRSCDGICSSCAPPFAHLCGQHRCAERHGGRWSATGYVQSLIELGWLSLIECAPITLLCGQHVSAALHEGRWAAQGHIDLGWHCCTCALMHVCCHRVCPQSHVFVERHVSAAATRVDELQSWHCAMLHRAVMALAHRVRPHPHILWVRHMCANATRDDGLQQRICAVPIGECAGCVSMPQGR